MTLHLTDHLSVYKIHYYSLMCINTKFVIDSEFDGGGG